MPKLRTREAKDIGAGIAVNLCDLDRLDPLIKSLLLDGKLDLDTTHLLLVDKDRMDETAVRFTCDLFTAACVCDTLRSRDRRAGDYPTRVYVRWLRAWEKLHSATLLTKVLVDNEVVLNPELFKTMVPAREQPRAERVTL